jgi:hypothetical protein
MTKNKYLNKTPVGQLRLYIKGTFPPYLQPKFAFLEVEDDAIAASREV